MKNFNIIKRNEKQIAEDIKKKKDLHIKVEDEMAQITIDNILSKYSAEVVDVLKK